MQWKLSYLRVGVWIWGGIGDCGWRDARAGAVWNAGYGWVYIYIDRLRVVHTGGKIFWARGHVDESVHMVGLESRAFFSISPLSGGVFFFRSPSFLLKTEFDYSKREIWLPGNGE